MYRHRDLKWNVEKRLDFFFDEKIGDLLGDVVINEIVYNGTQKVQPENKRCFPLSSMTLLVL